MGNKQFLIILISLLSINSICGQALPKPINQLIKKLQKRGADTILVYISGCDGCEITNYPPNCDCFDKNTISSVYLMYKIKSKSFKESFSCCKESSLMEVQQCVSIPYFVSISDIFRKVDLFYENLKKNKRFPPPIATDDSFEMVALILPKKHFEFRLSSYQKKEGYPVWKNYFWIDKEIKLVNLIKQDLALIGN